MILKHIITFSGRPITVPIDDDKIDAEFENIKAQIVSQGGNADMLNIYTDIELEENKDYKFID